MEAGRLITDLKNFQTRIREDETKTKSKGKATGKSFNSSFAHKN
jgi:hypothetical protein